MGNICCQESSSHPNNKQVKSLLSHKEVLTAEAPEQIMQEQIEQIIRHSVAVHNDKKYNLEDFVVLAELGKGGFATVFLVQLKQNRQKGVTIKYAMKRSEKKKLIEKKVMQNLLVEKKILAEIKNPFMIQLAYAFQDRKYCYFVMEYACGGDVYSLIQPSPRSVEYKKTVEEVARFILATVVLALETLHSKKIMYRDLKPENVLIFQDGYTKLADFGLAKRIESDDDLAKTMAGTKIYFAPQIVQKSGHNFRVDFWTLGVFLHQLILFKPPMEHDRIVKGKFIKQCELSERKRQFKGTISDEAKDMINSFLRVKPNERLGANGFQQIKDHPFFKGFDWAKLQRLEMESPLKPIIKKFPLQLKALKTTLQEDESGGETYDKIDGITYKEASKY